jgi:hypothetical protein
MIRKIGNMTPFEELLSDPFESSLAQPIYSIRKPSNLRKVNNRTEKCFNPMMKLDKMVTIEMMRSLKGVSEGATKKMLYVPSFDLVVVKEIPIHSKEMRFMLKQKISDWEKLLLGSNGSLLKLHGSFWNAPEGCVSIAMEYANGGSL